MKYLNNVVTLKFDREKCTGCGMCTNVCPHGVFKINGSKADMVNRDLCMECGACAKNCPFSAIDVRAGVGCAYGIIRGNLNGGGACCG